MKNKCVLTGRLRKKLQIKHIKGFQILNTYIYIMFGCSFSEYACQLACLKCCEYACPGTLVLVQKPTEPTCRLYCNYTERYLVSGWRDQQFEQGSSTQTIGHDDLKCASVCILKIICWVSVYVSTFCFVIYNCLKN